MMSRWGCAAGCGVASLLRARALGLRRGVLSEILQIDKGDRDVLALAAEVETALPKTPPS